MVRRANRLNENAFRIRQQVKDTTMRSSSTLRARFGIDNGTTARTGTGRRLLAATTLLACCVGLAAPQVASAQNRDRERDDRDGGRSAAAQTQAQVPAQPRPQGQAPAQQQPRTPPANRGAPPAAGVGYTSGTARPAYTAPPPGPNYGGQPRDAGSWRGQPAPQPVSGAAPPQRPEPRPESRRGDEDRRSWDERNREGGRGDGGRWDGRNYEGRNYDGRNYDGRNYDGRNYEGRGEGRREWRYRGEAHPAYRIAPYRYPNGWAYRSWRIGERMPFLFLSPYYFIDYFAYDLPPPPYGYRWVRYGPDALLVNVYTGEVEDVVYGIFYW
jgi:Ni/Co efflux regulator RcnB